MAIYEPVARYHVSNSSDYSDEENFSDEADERQSFISFRGVSARRIPSSHVVSNMAEDVEAAMAAAELDGNRPRKINPLTIIQVKNPEKNVDDGSTFSSFFARISKSILSFVYRRSCCVAVSTFLCLTVSVALFSLTSSLPCGGQPDCAAAVKSTHPARIQSQKINQRQWLRIYDDIMLSSGLEVVPLKDEKILVSGFQSSVRSKSTAPSYGMIALDASDGTEKWRRSLFAKPLSHDCQLVNLNDDDQEDCLVVGERGLVAAINPKNGDELWYLLYHIPLVNVSLPRKLPDLDGDGVLDLVAACAVTLPSEVTDQHSHPRTNFILISGKSGIILGRPYLVQTCTDISTLNITNELSIQFDCISEIGPDQFEMSLEELYLKVTNQHLPLYIRQLIPDAMSYQFGANKLEWHQFGTPGEDQTETIKDSIHLDWTTFFPECPECGVRVKLWDGFAHRILWNRTWPNAVAFQPRSTRYETDRWDSPIEGFVFRLWKWNDPQDTFTVGRHPDDKSSRDTTKSVRSTRSQVDDHTEESSIFDLSRQNDDFMDEDEQNRVQASPYEWISNMIPFGHPNLGRHILSVTPDGPNKRHRRYIYDKKKTIHHNSVTPKSSASHVRMLNVTEVIYYATLNHTNPLLVKLYSHDILQKCELDAKTKSFSCFPHYLSHANSMVILERKDDPDSRDLIFSSQTLVRSNLDRSHLGKFQIVKDEVDPWTLKTKIRKLRLAKDIRQVPHL